MVSFADLATASYGVPRMGTLTSSASLRNGRPWSLGARWDGLGVNFALFSAHAERVELCIFEVGKTQTYQLPKCTDQVWHGYLPDAAPGLCYAFRVLGPRVPGHRFDPSLLLVDPYARELSGVFSYDRSTSAANCLTGDKTRNGILRTLSNSVAQAISWR